MGKLLSNVWHWLGENDHRERLLAVVAVLALAGTLVSWLTGWFEPDPHPRDSTPFSAASTDQTLVMMTLEALEAFQAEFEKRITELESELATANDAAQTRLEVENAELSARRLPLFPQEPVFDSAIWNIPSRRQAEIRARVVRAQGHAVEIVLQPDGTFTIFVTRRNSGVFESVEPLRATLLTRVKPLLDLIAQAESGDNYNAYFGRRNNSDLEFSSMTIDEVMAWQHSFIAAGSPSSGVGRYMLINNTMRGLIGALGLSGKEKYDPSTQDKMAVKLLQGRGLDSFLSGSKNEDNFMNDIAREWASLPTTSGRSHYAGDGLNIATVSVGDVRSALQAVKGG